MENQKLKKYQLIIAPSSDNEDEFAEAGNTFDEVKTYLSDPQNDTFGAKLVSFDSEAERTAFIQGYNSAIGYQGDGFWAKNLVAETYDDWIEIFKPQTNHLNDNASFNGWAYETYGKEEAYVKQLAETEPNRVWTVLDCDGELYIGAGLHHVNRLNYFVTQEGYSEDFFTECCIPIDDPENFVVATVRGGQLVELISNKPITGYLVDFDNDDVDLHPSEGEVTVRVTENNPEQEISNLLNE